jgi:uncharacterized membrane protein/Mg-chelatase subunit ChlD
MFTHSFTFHSAWYLLLLALLPLVWLVSFRSLAGLGKWRRWLAIGLRSLVILLVVFALADMQYQRSSDRVTVIYLLDQSLSIPEARRSEMIRFVNASIVKHRRDDKEDRAGVIAFGRNAEVEVPPVDFDIQLASRVESLLDPEYTNLASAMQRAMALFPHDAAKRIVVVTDGNENLGDALEQARAMADAGVSIDVLPVPLARKSEVSVEKLAIPADVRRGAPFELRVVANNSVPEGAEGLAVTGRLRIVRKAGERETTLADAPVELPPGKTVFPLREEIEQSDFYTYEARFTPDEPAADAMAQNNLATAFTHVRGKGMVLLIEDWENPGAFDPLVEALRSEGLEVQVGASNQLFTSLPELQRYDTVILANVPRSSGFDANNVSSFTDDQIRMLVRNTEELGCGLIMMGGANSFGAGGWTNTELEKAMPVDFQIKSAKVVPVGALVLNMHAGEIPQANYWQKVIAQEAIKALGERDYCGLIQWDGTDSWLWGQSKGGIVRVGENRRIMLSRIDRMTIGDMPAFDPSLKMAAAGLARLTDASVKHMIIISDGDPTPPTPGTIMALQKQSVKVTTVTVGDPNHAPQGIPLMQGIAMQTGGKHYIVKDAKALPRIYQREARRVSRPLVYEPNPPVRPRVTTTHEMIQGLEAAFPPVAGFVLTTVKESSLVEVVLTSPLPVNEENATILAAWTYGLGKTVAFTTDAGERWANAWTGWENYARFFSQMVRWSMRPTGDTGNFTVATDVGDGKTRVTVTALDKDDEFLNYQAMTGTVLGPDMKSIPLEIRQTAPGRYSGEFDSQTAGSYLILVTPGSGQGMIRTGVNVGYSDEFRDQETNMPLLESMAGLTPSDGEPGKLMEPLSGTTPAQRNAFAPQLAFDPYRRDLPPAVASRDIWPLLVLLGSCVFFADIFVRRVQVSFLWLLPLVSRMLDAVLRRERAAEEPQTMSRLRSRKAEVDEQLESRRAASRFEPDPEMIIDISSVQQAAPKGRPAARPQTADKPLADQDKPAEESYTSRLLKAKKQVWQDREKDKS